MQQRTIDVLTDQGVLVGIIDTGVDYNHPDLVGRMWDGSAYQFNNLQLIHHGYDFGQDDNDPMDVATHGTRVAGIVAGDGTGGAYQTGVAPGVMIMAIKVVDIGLTSQSLDLAGLQFAIDFGADIINMSRSWEIWRVPPPNYETWRRQTDAELAAGIIHINSIGNDSPSSAAPIPYNINVPANCPPPWLHLDQTLIGGLSSVLGVQVVDDTDSIFPGPFAQGPSAWEQVSDYYPAYPFTLPQECLDYPHDNGRLIGLLKPDLSAPGSGPLGVNTTNLGGGYILFGQTSAAAPHVSGTAALLLSVNANFTPAAIAQMLLETAIDVDPPGRDNVSGAGRVDAYQAILKAIYLDVPVEFSTIQAAINAAQSGQIVRVAAGTYNESIFMKSGVDVIGAGIGNTILIAPSSGSKAVNFYNVSDCKFEGFTVQNGKYGAYLTGTSNITLFNNRFVSTLNQPYGIRVMNSSSLNITTNTITGYYYGIILSSCTGTLSIYNNTISDYTKGILLSNSSPTITNNTLDSGSWGISASNNSDNLWG
ncbi:S8 family serine peptidase [candidate division KSB1 bacterium]|nr:S8 family serine peptidase [candidate division KSB1 bacterium]